MAEEKAKKSLAKTYTPQSLVHIKHSISALQYKYWLIALKLYGEAYHSQTLELDEKGFFFIDMGQVIELLGYEPNKKEIKKDLEEIRKEPITINYLEKDGKSATHGMGFISEWKLTSTKVGVKFPSFVVDAITGNDEKLQRMFLQMNWNIFNSFTGKYEAIIYKLCKDYVGVGRTPLFSVEKYREYIGLKDGEYPQFKELNRWTLSNPIKTINDNELSDLTVAVHFERKGRKVTGLYFTMKKKEKTPIPLPEIQPSPAFKNAMINITAEQQTKYLERYTPEQITKIIDSANSYIEQLKANKKPANIGGIYAMAFAKGWGLADLEAEKNEKAKRQKQEQKKAAEEKAEARKKEQEAADREKILDDFFSLPEEEKIRRLEAVISAEKNKTTADIFKKALENKRTLALEFDQLFYIAYKKLFIEAKAEQKTANH